MRLKITSLTEPVAYHCVARARFPHAPFTERSACQRTWVRLRRSFPHCLGAVLMPNHLHLLLWHEPSLGTDVLRHRLRRCLPGNGWDPLPEPQAIPDIHHLKRQLRYVHLNPNRKNLVRDPLAWEWSTHIDYAGGCTDPWPDGPETLLRLGYGRGPSAVHAFHHYVSADPSAHVQGTPPLQSPTGADLIDIAAAIHAAEIAYRAPKGIFLKKGKARARLAQLLWRVLGVQQARVAKALGVSRGTISGASASFDHVQLQSEAVALLRVLSDPRFKRTQPNKS